MIEPTELEPAGRPEELAPRHEQTPSAQDAQPVLPAPAPAVYSSSDWDGPTKRSVVIILLVVFVGVLWISRPVLPLLVVAAIIAYLVSPLVDGLERLRVPRPLSTIVFFVLFLVALVLAPVLFVPVLVRQLISLSNFDVASTAPRLLSWFNDLFSSLPDTIDFLGFEIPLGEILRNAQADAEQFNIIPSLSDILTYIQQLISTATSVVGSTAVIGFNVVGGIFQVLLSILIVFFLSLYMTKDAPLIRSYVAGLFPRSYQPEVGDVFHHIGKIWQGFFRGQLVLCLVIGVMTYVALSLAGMPGALLLALLAGLLEVIPNIGPIVAMIPAVFVALIQGSPVLGPMGVSNFGFALITVGIYFLIQQIENNIIVPRVIGDSVDLHPVVVICGVFVGLELAGILGAFLAAPIIASGRVVGGYIHAKLLGYTPFVSRDRPRRQRKSYRRTVKGGSRANRPAASTRPAAEAPLPPHVPPPSSNGAFEPAPTEQTSAQPAGASDSEPPAGDSLPTPM